MNRTTLRRITAGTAGALLVALGVFVAASWLKESRERKAAVAPQQLPPNVNQQLSGYTFTRSEGGRPVFTVSAARNVAFNNGRATRLEDVKVEIFGRTGNGHDLLQTKRCDYDQPEGALSCSGQVDIELNAPVGSRPASMPPMPATFRGPQPVYLRTSDITFQQQTGLVESDKPLQWRFGPASGSAVGLKYAAREGWVELEKNVEIEVPPSAGRNGSNPNSPLEAPLHLTASGLRFSKSEHRIDLRGPVEVTEGGRTLRAGRATVGLDDRNRAASLSAQDGVEGSDSEGGRQVTASSQNLVARLDPASGALRTLVASDGVHLEQGSTAQAAASGALSADELTLNFAGPQSLPRDGAASGNARLYLNPTGPAAKSRRPSDQTQSAVLAAERIDFAFRPDGSSLESARTAGPGRLQLIPADPKSGERQIAAGRFEAAFDTRSRMEKLDGVSGIQLVAYPARDAPLKMPLEGSCDQIEARFDARSETVESLVGTGHVAFHQGERHATGERAAFDSTGQTLALTGHPVLWGPDSRMSADRFLIETAKNVTSGFGHVQATHLGKPSAKQPTAKAEPPGAVHVLADRVTADRSRQTADYSGHVRAWSGQDVLEAPAVSIDWNQRRATATGGVLTTDLAPSTKPAPAATQPVTIRADVLDYFDLGREATYTGHVEIRAQGGMLTADRAEAYFSQTEGVPGQPLLERAVAAGHVNVTEAGRRATADRALYHAATGSVVMTGGPPALYDVANQGFATGQRLTFFIRDATVILDGGENSPAISKRRVTR